MDQFTFNHFYRSKMRKKNNVLSLIFGVVKVYVMFFVKFISQ